jgi:hypothetical protein
MCWRGGVLKQRAERASRHHEERKPRGFNQVFRPVFFQRIVHSGSRLSSFFYRRARRKARDVQSAIQAYFKAMQLGPVEINFGDKAWKVSAFIEARHKRAPPFRPQTSRSRLHTSVMPFQEAIIPCCFG